MATPVCLNGAGGRMGQMLVRMVEESGDHTLAGAVEPHRELKDLDCIVGTSLAEVMPKLAQGSVVIDFTAPEVSVQTARLAAQHGVPAVIGTTGLTPDQQAELDKAARTVPLVWAPNMSMGINALVSLLPELVRALGPAYDLEVMEIHHNRKKDSPSGTAIKLAEVLAQGRDWNLEEHAAYCRHGIIGERPAEELGVQTLRGGDVVGDHTVYFFGPGERIEITHRAHSRENFARGALRAASWLAGKKSPGRLYLMADVLAAE